MTTLHMKTEEVRNAAHQLDLAVGDLYFKSGKLKSAAGSLRSAWQGGKSNYYANQLQQMGNQMHEEVINLQRLVKRLYGEVAEWEYADSTHDFATASLIQRNSLGNGATIWDYSGLLRDSIKLGATLGVIGGLIPGATYAGQVIFRGGHALKELAGLAPNLTHLKAANLPNHLNGPHSSKLGIAMTAWEMLETGTKDWANYDKTNERLAAVGLDAAFITVKTFTEHYAGHLAATGAVSIAGSLLVAAGIPVVGLPAVGVAAVGMLAWWGGSYVTGKVMDHVFDSYIKESAVQAVASTSGVEKMADVVDSAWKGMQETTQKVDHAFKNVISNFF